MKANILPKDKSCKLDIYLSEKEILNPFEVVCLIDARTGKSVFHDGILVPKTGVAVIKAIRYKQAQ